MRIKSIKCDACGALREDKGYTHITEGRHIWTRNVIHLHLPYPNSPEQNVAYDFCSTACVITFLSDLEAAVPKFESPTAEELDEVQALEALEAGAFKHYPPPPTKKNRKFACGICGTKFELDITDAQFERGIAVESCCPRCTQER